MSREGSNSVYEVLNKLTGEWEPLVSPHRMGRPWQGQVELQDEKKSPEYDKACYLCPGNTRNSGDVNPDYKGTWFFTNDFSALLAPVERSKKSESDADSFFQKREDSGVCEVLLYSPRHDLTMNTMNNGQIEDVIRLWTDRYMELGQNDFINHIQIFENKGPGASNPHPHAQLWSQKNIPLLPEKELRQQSKYFEKHGKSLLVDYSKEELKKSERVISENKHFVTVVPYWAVWPYETIILPKTQRTGLDQLSGDEVASLASSLSILTRTYADFFQRPKYGAPYTMGVHQRPTDGMDHPEAQLHIHFEPPLLTPDRFKHMVGYERFAQAQRDVTAEQAAMSLREIAQKQ